MELGRDEKIDQSINKSIIPSQLRPLQHDQAAGCRQRESHCAVVGGLR